MGCSTDGSASAGTSAAADPSCTAGIVLAAVSVPASASRAALRGVDPRLGLDDEPPGARGLAIRVGVVSVAAGEGEPACGPGKANARRALRRTEAGVPFSLASSGTARLLRCPRLRTVTGVPRGTSGVPSWCLKMPGVLSRRERANADPTRPCCCFGVPSGQARVDVSAWSLSKAQRRAKMTHRRCRTRSARRR